MQSFLPLTILLLLKYFEFGLLNLIGTFFCGLWHRDFSILILTILGYKTFQFKFVGQNGILQNEKDLIGITCEKIDEN